MSSEFRVQGSELLRRLADLSPCTLTGLDLFARLQAQPPEDVAELMAMQPELEQAVEKLERVAYATRRMVERCNTLKAQPGPRVPAGF